MFSTARSGAPSAAATASIIASDLVITGSLRSKGDIRIEGRVDGKVACARLDVCESGAVRGEIAAQTVTVRGRVEGAIRARSLSLSATARVDADILHQALEVQSGAVVRGQMRPCRDPLAENLAESGGEAERRSAHAPMRAATARAPAAQDLRAAG